MDANINSPWQFGVDYEAIGPGSAQDLFDEMLEVRRTLRSQSSTRWTVVSTGLFMSYLFLADFGAVDFPLRTVRGLGGWSNRVTVTTPEDIGRAVAEMVFVPAETENRVVRIGGETITYEELASVLEEAVCDGEWRREEWTLDFLRERLRAEPDNLWYKYQCIFADGRGVSWNTSETLNYQRGMTMTGLRDYITQNFGTRN